MKSFKIWCETNEIRDKVLAKMESEDIIWHSGQKPTEIKYNAPIKLIVRDKKLTYAYKKYSDFVDHEEIIAEEYLNGGKKEMKKSDLRTGHIVTTRNGSEYVVYQGVEIRGTIEGKVLVGKKENKSWEPLDNYKEDLTHCFISDFDIVKVEEAYSVFVLQDIDYMRDNRKTIWKREKEPKEMTVAEIENLLGYPVKIVK